LDAMGQQLFAPPNVKGWPGGKAWLNTSTVLARHNFAQMIAAGTLKTNPNEGRFADDDRTAEFIEIQEQAAEEAARKAGNAPKSIPEPPADPTLDMAAAVRAAKIKEPAGMADLLVEMLLQGEASQPSRTKVGEFLKGDDASLDRRIRAAAHAIMTMPEY